jgi:hypothetical protein
MTTVGGGVGGFGPSPSDVGTVRDRNCEIPSVVGGLGGPVGCGGVRWL